MPGWNGSNCLKLICLSAWCSWFTVYPKFHLKYLWIEDTVGTLDFEHMPFSIK